MWIMPRASFRYSAYPPDHSARSPPRLSSLLHSPLVPICPVTVQSQSKHTLDEYFSYLSFSGYCNTTPKYLLPIRSQALKILIRKLNEPLKWAPDHTRSYAVDYYPSIWQIIHAEAERSYVRSQGISTVTFVYHRTEATIYLLSVWHVRFPRSCCTL